jgi:hypothetical protein
MLEIRAVQTPCFAELASAFRGSHSNTDSVYTEYHGMGREQAFALHSTGTNTTDRTLPRTLDRDVKVGGFYTT